MPKFGVLIPPSMIPAGPSTWLLLTLLLCVGTVPERASAQTRPQSAAANVTTNGTDPPSWLFPIDELNHSLPGWLRVGGEYRNRFEGPLGVGFSNANDSYLLDRLRVRLAIEPRQWLRFFGEVQDARVLFNGQIATSAAYQDTWTLWQAYAQFGTSTAGWIDGLAGRQVLAFGDERVIGPSDWSNVGRTFNLVRVDLHHPGYRVSFLSSSVVPAGDAHSHGAIPGDNLHGIYASFDSIIPHASFEPYLFWHLAPDNLVLPETLGRGHLSEVTIGLHVKGILSRDFDYDAEFDGQTGSLGRYSVDAWAGYASVGKTLSNTAGLPRIFVEGNYASGTKNPGGRRWNTFDQLYPSNHNKYGFADLVGRRNLEQFRVGVEEKIGNKLRLKQAFEGFWLATSGDNFYASSGAIAVPAKPGSSRHIGNELDLIGEYKINEGLSIGFGYGHMFAGGFLKTATQGHDYSYPYAYLEYNFSKSRSRTPR